MRASIPTVTLHNGRPLPQLGLGTWQVKSDAATAAVSDALAAGYRLIDTAAVYENEAAVGAGLRAARLPREELFVTTKLWNDEQGYDTAVRGLEASLQRLGLDYVDLYLIHWPVPQRDKYVETWRALSQLREEGRTKSIGVSNFTVEHLERIIGETGDIPVVNQIELHPRFPQAELRAYHAKHRIITESWSPLAQGELMKDLLLAELAIRHDKTPAQIILRWHVENGLVAIPKSSRPERIAENLQIFDFKLSAEEMEKLASLETGQRIGPDPETFAGG